MRQLHTLALTVLMGLSGLGCATAPSAAVHDPSQPIANSSCRNVTSLEGRVQSMCATPAQWAEFDSRMAQLDQGFSCRPVKGSQPLCLFARQWKYVERTNALRAGALSNGSDEATRSAMAISQNDYATIRLGMIDSLATTGGTPIP